MPLNVADIDEYQMGERFSGINAKLALLRFHKRRLILLITKKKDI